MLEIFNKLHSFQCRIIVTRLDNLDRDPRTNELFTPFWIKNITLTTLGGQGRGAHGLGKEKVLCRTFKKLYSGLNCNSPSALAVAVQLLEYLCAHAVQNEKANMRSTKKLGDTCWEIFQMLGDAISQHDT